MSHDLSGTNLAANGEALARTICYELRIAWGRTADTWPSDWATQSTDESARLRDVSWDRRFALDKTLSFGQSPLAQMRLTLDNYDQRFSPYNTSSPIYSSISADATTPGGATMRYPKMWQVPVRLRMGFVDATNGNEFLTVFSGLIDTVGDDFGTSGDTVTLTVLDRGAALLDRKASTKVFRNWYSDAIARQLVEVHGGIPVGEIDRGTFNVPFWWLDDESIWAEVQYVAQADGALAFFDEYGAFQYKNAAWWATSEYSTVSRATFDSDHFQTLSPSVDYKTLATGAIVEYQPRSYGGEQVLWRSNTTIVLPTGETTVQARFSMPATEIFPPAYPGDWLPATGGGIDASNSVSVELVNPSGQRVDLLFNNGDNQTVFVQKMQLRGLVLVGGPQEQVEQAVATPLVPTKTEKLGGNAYVQTRAQAQLIALLTASRMRYPRLTYKTSGPALPWLQLGDRVTIDATPLSSARYAIVTGLSFSWSPDQPWTMTADSVDVAALYEYDNYHIIGTDRYGEKVAFA